MDVIVNPAAGGGRARGIAKNWSRRLEEAGATVRVHYTSGLGQGSPLAQSLVGEGRRRLVVVGGDGTLGEVVDGVMRAGGPASDVTLGAIAAGTGRDFCRILNSDDSSHYVNLLVSDPGVPIDVGFARFETEQGDTAERYFLNIASFGVSGHVVQLVAQSKKRFGGKAAFASSSLRAMLRYTPSDVAISVDGRALGTFPINVAAVANGRFFGAGMCVAPTATVNDGLFELSVLEPRSLLASVWVMPSLYRGTWPGTPKTHQSRGRSLAATVVTGERVPIELDGESVGYLPLHTEIRPRALRFIGVGQGALVSAPAAEHQD